MRCDCPASRHVAKLRTAAVLADVAVIDGNADVPRYGLGGVDAAAIEVGDVGTVYFPCHVAGNLFLSRSSHFAKASAADVALGIVGSHRCIGLEHAGEIEFLVVAACDGNWDMRGEVRLVGMYAVVEHLEPSVSAEMDVLGMCGVGTLVGRDYLLDDASLDDERRGGFVVVVVVFELIEVCQTGIRYFEPSARLEYADTGHAGASIGFLCHTDSGPVEEVEADRTDVLPLLVLIDEAVVGFVVAVVVDGHQRKGHVVVLDRVVAIVAVVVACQHDSIVEHGMCGIASEIGDGCPQVCVYPLPTASSGVLCVVCEACARSGEVGCVAIGAVVCLVEIGVGAIYGFCPIGLDGDRGHAIGNVEVCALGEHASRHAEEVFLRTVAVGKVVALIGVFCFVAAGIASAQGCYLPSRHDTSAGVVACAYIIIIGQLHFAIVEVVAGEVFVGDVECEGVAGDACPCWRSELSASCAHADVEGQRAQLAALVALGRERCALGIVVDDGGVLALPLQYGKRLGGVDVAVGCFEHPFGHYRACIGGRTRGVPCCQLAVGVEQIAVELEAREEAVLGRKGAVIDDVLACDGGGEAVVVVVVDACVVVGGTVAADDVSAVDGRDVGAADDVAVEHAVHYHAANVGGDGSVAVIAYQSAHIRAARYVGKAEAVDDAGVAVGVRTCATQVAHQAADIAAAADASREHAAVVDATHAAAGCSGHYVGYSADVCASADVDVGKEEVLHFAVSDAGEQGTLQAADGVEVTIERACEGNVEAGTCGDVGGELVVSGGIGDVGERTYLCLSQHVAAECKHQNSKQPLAESGGVSRRGSRRVNP